MLATKDDYEEAGMIGEGVGTDIDRETRWSSGVDHVVKGDHAFSVP